MSMTSILYRLIERLFETKPIKPVGVSEWPMGVNANCLGFAVGHIESCGLLKRGKMKLDCSLEIGNAFISRLKSLGYNLPRRISGMEEANSDEFVIAVFGFSNYQLYEQFQGIVSIEGDFHLVRRELDGTWVHKPGWIQRPRRVSKADEEDIRRKFDVSKVALFAFKAPAAN